MDTEKVEKRKGSSNSAWEGRSGWSSVPPNLRLIEIVLLPSLREAFLARDNNPNRQALDARGTIHEPVSFWEKVQRLFNDESFSLESIVLDSSWGGRFFLEKINLGWETQQACSVAPLESALLAKQKFMALSNSLGNILQRWRRSGTGDGNADDLSCDNGASEQPAAGYDNIPSSGGDQYNFIGDANPSAMYLWYKLDCCGLLEQSLAEITDDFAADGNAGPNTLGVTSRSSSTPNSTASPPNATLNAFSEMLETYAKKQDENVKLIVATMQEKNKTNERNASILSQVNLLTEKKRSYNELLIKTQESIDRASEQADDEECNGNDARRQLWVSREKKYTERMKQLKRTLSSFDDQIATCFDAEDLTSDRDKDGNGAADLASQDIVEGNSAGNATNQEDGSGTVRDVTSTTHE